MAARQATPNAKPQDESKTQANLSEPAQERGLKDVTNNRQKAPTITPPVSGLAIRNGKKDCPGLSTTKGPAANPQHSCSSYTSSQNQAFQSKPTQTRKLRDTAPYIIQPSSCITARRKSYFPCNSAPAGNQRDKSFVDWIPSEPFETDPRLTKALWNRVMASNSMKAPRGRASRLPTRSKETEGSTEPSTIPSTTLTKTRKPSPTDSTFRSNVLEPRGILINDDQPSQDVFRHFKTQPPPDDPIKHYKGLERAEASSVWLDITDDDALKAIIEEYLFMKMYSLCEAEFATYGKETFLKADPRPFNSTGRPWVTTRMVELVAKPSPRMRWYAPPLLGKTAVLPNMLYEFDIRADCAYWMSLQCVNPEYLFQVADWTCVIYNRITCPYFTIEFKKDDSTEEAAENQVATAATLALYNRVQLKLRRMNRTKRPWNRMHLEQLKHYALTFTGPKFSVWLVSVKWTEEKEREWAGCVMEMLCQGDCTLEASVRSLVNWLNEIHRWGLTVHGPSCERDIKACINENHRTSLTRDELRVDGDIDDDDELGATSGNLGGE